MRLVETLAFTPPSVVRSAELQLRAMALHPGRAELELYAPMGDMSAPSGGFHSLWCGIAPWRPGNE